MRASALLAVIALLSVSRFVLAAAVSPEAVKATFLYRFASYVEWPPTSSEGDLTIGVVDNEDVAAELERSLPGIVINGRRVRIERLQVGDSLARIHILYVGNSTSIHARRLREAARRKAILLVTSTPRGLEDGAVINFLDAARTVKFEVSLSNAERAGLEISSRLLSVAAHVEGKARAINPWPIDAGAALLSMRHL